MKTILRVVSSFLVALVGYGSCCAQSPPEITMCELFQHPAEYAGKIIKVRGGSVSGLEISDILHDSDSQPCTAFLRIRVVFPDQVKPAPGFDLVRDEAYRKLGEALHSSIPIRIDATYEGRFDAAFVWRDHKRIQLGQEKGYGKKHQYDARIVLRQVSDVWALPLPHK